MKRFLITVNKNLIILSPAYKSFNIFEMLPLELSQCISQKALICCASISILNSSRIIKFEEYCTRVTKFSTNPFFIFQRFECYTTLILKELLYNKNQSFYFYFKKRRNLHNYITYISYITYITIYKYICRRCNSSYYGETNRHLKVRSGEHIGISPLK